MTWLTHNCVGSNRVVWIQLRVVWTERITKWFGKTSVSFQLNIPLAKSFWEQSNIRLIGLVLLVGFLRSA